MNRYIFLIQMIAFIAIYSCEEVYSDSVESIALIDTTYINSNPSEPQSKVVLVEEITGVRCSNCPRGHEIVKNMEDHTLKGKVAVVAIHPYGSSFTKPYDGDSSFATIYGQALASKLNVSSYPTAAIDRVLNDQSGVRLFPFTEWESKAASLSTQSTPVNVSQIVTYDPSIDHYILSIYVEFTQEYSKQVELTGVLIENDLKATQLQPDGSTKIKDYKHSKTLRRAIVDSKVLNFSSGKTKYSKGQVYRLDYYIEMDNGVNLKGLYNISNCYTVAFVVNSESKEVLQANKIKVN